MHDGSAAGVRSERTRKGGVSVAKHQHSVGVHLAKCRIKGTHHCIKSLRAMQISWLRQEKVWGRHPKVTVDLAGKQLVVVLGGVNDERLDRRREVWAKGGKLDELRARSDDRRDAH
jgi:hypothetical protein